MLISNSSPIDVPSAVSGSVGKYNSPFSRLVNVTSSLSAVNPTSEYTKYYAIYSKDMDAYIINNSLHKKDIGSKITFDTETEKGISMSVCRKRFPRNEYLVKRSAAITPKKVFTRTVMMVVKNVTANADFTVSAETACR